MQSLNQLLSTAVRETCPPKALEIIAKSNNLVRDARDRGKGPNLTCRAPRAIYNALRAGSKAVLEIQVVTAMGATRLRRHENVKSLAQDILFAMPLEDICVDARASDDGTLYFTTREYAIEQNEQGLLQCPNCAKFFSGNRGLRDHQIVVHLETYEQSVTVAQRATYTLVTINHHNKHLQQAKRNGQILKLEKLQARAIAKQTTPQIQAIQNGNLQLVQTFVNNGWDPNKQEKQISTPIEWACGKGHLHILEYLIQKCNCDPNLNNKHGLERTPLHWACRNNHLNIVTYLVNKCNVNINATMADGSTPFHYAVYGENRNICQFLKNNGANIHAINKHGCNAVQWAALNGSITMLEYLRQIKLDFTLSNKNKHNVLHKAAQRGHINACEWLEKNIQYDYNRPDKTGLLPKDLARINGFQWTLA